MCQKIKGLKRQCDPDGEKNQEVCSTLTENRLLSAARLCHVGSAGQSGLLEAGSWT